MSQRQGEVVAVYLACFVCRSCFVLGLALSWCGETKARAKYFMGVASRTMTLSLTLFLNDICYWYIP